MSTLPITNALATTKPTSAQSTAPARTDEGSQFGANAFMKLLISELKNQDPLDPMESRDMIAQLAQLSSVEKLDTINTSLASLNDGISNVSNNATVGLIGKKITADGSKINLESVGSTSLDFTLSAPATTVEVVVRNSSGNVVRTFNLGQQTTGSHRISWDGKDDSGAREKAGVFTASVSAKDQNGNLVACSQQITGLVNKVSYDNGEAELVVNNARISLSNVLSISQ